MSEIESLENTIHKYIDEIHKTIPQETPSVLYHYTDGLGLEGILKSGNLWVSDIFSMNDPSEITHGIKIAKQELENTFRSGTENKPEYFPNILFNPVLELIKKTANYFICCFSKTGDDLGQWRAYATNGHGYALGFKGETLDKLFCSAQNMPACQTFPIDYMEKNLVEWNKGLAKIFFDNLAKKQHKKIEYDEYLPYMMGVLMLSLLHKHWGYQNELEYRFMQIFPNNDEQIPGLKYRLKQNKKEEYSLAGYREFSWKDHVPCPLQEIIIGPASDFERAKRFAEDCLKAYGYDLSQITIKQSEIPYRS